MLEEVKHLGHASIKIENINIAIETSMSKYPFCFTFFNNIDLLIFFSYSICGK